LNCAGALESRASGVLAISYYAIEAIELLLAAMQKVEDPQMPFKHCLEFVYELGYIIVKGKSPY